MRPLLPLILAGGLSFLALNSQAEVFDHNNPEDRKRFLHQAFNLIKQDDPKQAYQLLKSVEQRYSQSARYNYLFAMAALQTQRAEEASWILERVITQQPSNAEARMLLGRAYYELGNYEKSKQEFEFLKSIQPPQAAKKIIQLYLGMIDRKTVVEPDWRLSGRLFSAIGFDSNINSAPIDETILPAPFMQALLMTFGQADGSIEVEKEKSSAFLTLGAANRLEYKQSESTFFWGRYQADTKQFFEHNEFSTVDFDIAGGARRHFGAHMLSTELAFNNSWRDGDSNKVITSLQGVYSYASSQRSLLGGYVVWEDQRFPEVKNNNAQVVTLGLTGNYIAGQIRPVVLQTGLFAGIDQAENNRADGDKTMYGGRLGAQYIFNQTHRFSADLTLTHSEYDQENISFAKKRTDSQFNTGVGHNWQLSKAVSLQTRLNFSRVESNIALYDTEKFEAYIQADYRY